ncbi:NADPH-binding protein [Nitzschia inconspicua]|uniref:NADPH-binding protein n=1 Tax=Nitzschia inconspicua TaxID=303405 RepID=A0A9K3KNB9_9STRA|nr:NADPH-binding protein [Nitzschia inconspicua]
MTFPGYRTRLVTTIELFRIYETDPSAKEVSAPNTRKSRIRATPTRSFRPLGGFELVSLLGAILLASITLQEPSKLTATAFTLNTLPCQSGTLSSITIRHEIHCFGRRVRGTAHNASRRSFGLSLSNSKNDDNGESDKPKASISKKRSSRTKDNSSKKKKEKNKKAQEMDPALKTKKEIMQQLKAKMEEKRKMDQDSNNASTQNKKIGNTLGKLINPFQAGRELRQTLGSLTTLGRGLSDETKQKYYLDDRFLDSSKGNGSGGTGPRSSASGILSSFSASSFLQEAADTPSYVPEVLVIGATGEIGRLVVRRLLLEGRFQVRVLVRDLYSQTLNLLGTGVSYCQGDLNNVESLEYALTDVDKIVYVAGAPRPDEKDFQTKFQRYLQEHDVKLDSGDDDTTQRNSTTAENLEWEQLASVLEVRAELAEQVDLVGMQNVVSAYQNIRHADYGTSQAAKRSLFKFGSRTEDFNLFALDDGDDGQSKSENAKNQNDEKTFNDNYEYPDSYVDEEEEDEDYDDDYEMLLEARLDGDSLVKTQVQWIRNQFGNGVFVGRVPKPTSSTVVGGEAAIVSSRLRSRDDPELGIDLSNGFGGFILRLVSDGNQYEAFVRTGLYESDNIEYVCEFGTDTKRTSLDSKSRNRFKTVRLAFENFKPVKKRVDAEGRDDVDIVASFTGKDVRYIGFRFRSSSNPSSLDNTRKDKAGDSYQNFYVALSYIKVYRVQPEPEFIFLSDARIPPTIQNGMVQHEQRVILTKNNAAELEESDLNSMSATLFDGNALQSISHMERSAEETYFKYRGEEILKKSGLSYTIIRVAGFNESPTSEASTIDLVQSNTNLVPVSRSEVAQVCVSALMDPAALNKSVYMTKKKSVSNVWDEEDISAKFVAIPNDPV